MGTSRSIAELQADGFTHIEARCDCGKTTAIPFRMLQSEGRIVSSTIFRDLAARLICSRCKIRPATVRPWHIHLDGDRSR